MPSPKPKHRVYYSVDLDFFSDENSEERSASVQDVRHALAMLTSHAVASGLASIHLALDHRPDLLRGWSPRAILNRHGLIINLDSHDDAGADLQDGVNIGNWASHYRKHRIPVQWIVPPHGGWLCQDCRRTHDSTHRSYTDIPLPMMASLAFFASPGYSVNQGYELMVLMQVIDACATHGLRINDQDPGAMTIRQVRDFVY